MLSRVSSPTSASGAIDDRQRGQPAGAQPVERLLEAERGDTAGRPAVIASATVEPAPRCEARGSGCPG